MMGDLISRNAATDRMIAMAGCATCDHYNFVRCRACTWDDAMNIVEELEALGTTEVRINLNDEVRFKLTDRGREIYERHLDDALKHLPDVDRSALALAPDINGYVRMQLHRFMLIFGPHLINGAPVPVENVEIVYDLPEMGVKHEP